MKVFLKFNKESQSAKLCLIQWLTLFKDYEVKVICDLEEAETFLKGIVPKHLIVRTNYKLGFKYSNCYGGKKAKHWCRAASANLTAYSLADDDYFWLIDADDTMFLTDDLESIRNKIKLAECYGIDKNLDGFSLDFYREIVNDHWSFGVALLRTKIDLSKLKTIDPIRAINESKEANMDSAFDILRKDGIYNLENFIFDNTFFQHHVDRNKWLPFGVYHWKNNKLWDYVDIADGVINF